jgi:predicted Zn-dependent protease
MDNTEILIEEPPDVSATGSRPCPACGHHDDGPAGLVTSLFPQQRLRRCSRCGVRHAESGSSDRWVFTCQDCGLPFLAEEHTSSEDRKCSDCCSGRIPADLPDREVAEAIESEVRAALGVEWKFVNSPSLSVYLERMAGQLCRQMDPRPARSQVVLLEAPEWWTLALPSGTILLSLGTLVGLEDEAELAFVLAHELAHAASAEAAVRLVRTGLQVVALEDNGGHEPPWSHAAQDLIRLGYGRVRETDADRRAIEVVTALGYDPNSVSNYLRRVERLVADGDSRVAEIALAHPTPARRLRTVEECVAASPQPRVATRVNREVFRRVAGHDVLATRLERVEGFAEQSNAEPTGRAAAQRGKRRFWLAVALATLAAALGFAAWQLF